MFTVEAAGAFDINKEENFRNNQLTLMEEYNGEGVHDGTDCGR